MAILTTQFFKIRLLLATLSVMSLTLGATPIGYAQDVPTPTPPADGGTFDGAPEPTPDAEVVPEPELPVSEPVTDELPEGGLEGSTEAPAEGPTPETTPVELPSEPTSESPIDEPVSDVLSEEAESTSTVDEGSAVEETIEEDSAADEQTSTGANESPQNNSPRGLW